MNLFENLQIMKENENMKESYTSEEKAQIHKLWLDNLEKVMGYSKQICDDLRNHSYGDDAYSDKTYDTWKSLLIKNGIDVSNKITGSYYQPCVYKITYDTAEANNQIEEFEGSWVELQDYIKQMKDNDCYNINAICTYDPEW